MFVSKGPEHMPFSVSGRFAAGVWWAAAMIFGASYTANLAAFLTVARLETGRGRHDDVTKWNHFPRYWPFVRGIHRSPVNSPHKGQWRRTLMFSLICAWMNGWVNTREAGDLRHYRTHYDVTVMVNQGAVAIWNILQISYQNHISRNPICQ